MYYKSRGYDCNRTFNTKKPAILIPLPTAAENHQYYNAKVLENIGVGKIIEQKDLNENVLENAILNMIESENLQKMYKAFENANDLKNKENDNYVEEKIYECIENVMKEKV